MQQGCCYCFDLNKIGEAVTAIIHDSLFIANSKVKDFSYA